MVAKKVRNVGTIVVRGRERKLYEGKKGGIFYRSKGSKVYVDKKVLRQSSQKKKKVIAKKKNKFGAGEWHDFDHHLDNLGKHFDQGLENIGNWWNNSGNNHAVPTHGAGAGADRQRRYAQSEALGDAQRDRERAARKPVTGQPGTAPMSMKHYYQRVGASAKMLGK